MFEIAESLTVSQINKDKRAFMRETVHRLSVRTGTPLKKADTEYLDAYQDATQLKQILEEPLENDKAVLERPLSHTD